ncbi:MAG: cell division protein FtsW [Saprospiraceae bacterium]|jgi:cell division protein FtsW
MVSVAQVHGQVDQRAPSFSFDFGLAVVVSCILLLGVVMVYSAGIAKGSREFALHTAHIVKHGVHVGVGLIAMAMIIRFLRLDWVQAMSGVLLLVGLVLLAALFVPGVGMEVNGSTRWMQIAGVRLQPAELIKLLCLMYIADYYARKQSNVHLFKVGVLNIGLPILVVCGLLLAQPDFGTTVVILATTGGLMYLAGVRIGYFIGVFLCIAVAMALIAYLEPYRVDRLMVFQDPWADPFNKGFQLTQSLMAIGRGGWLGVGLGNSLQKLNYLPHADNDFLIAIVGEELGSLGIFIVMGLFALLLWRAFAIASTAMQRAQRFNAYLAYGIGLVLTFNAAIHVGVSTGLLPTKGLNLPLMSSGGSSMVISLACIGLLFAVDKANRLPVLKRAIPARGKR